MKTFSNFEDLQGFQKKFQTDAASIDWLSKQLTNSFQFDDLHLYEGGVVQVFYGTSM